MAIVKYEEVYLRAYDSVGEARASIGRYLDFYNGRRPHSSLDGTTPNLSLLHPAANPDGSLTPADAPLIDAEKKFRQPGPPQGTLGTKIGGGEQVWHELCPVGASFPSGG